jgi:hypothetical protein
LVMMNIQIEKLLLIGELARVEDIRVLAKIREVLCGDADRHGGTVGSRLLSEAKRRIKDGEYIPPEDIKRDVDNW